MSKVSRDLLQERTTEPEVFQDMTNFEECIDSTTFALSLRLQFPKFSKGFTSSDFETFVKSHIGEKNLVSLGRLSFPNEWQMQVANKDIRESLIRMGRTKINTRTCWISPLSQSEVRGFIHWIPTAVTNQKLENVLRAYGEILIMENIKQPKWTMKIDSDSRYFGLYLKSGKTMDDLPHFIKIDDYLGLITIRGRNPSCFHCKEVGHRKSECKKYREKLSEYCMRPAGSAKPRYKPRGGRFKKKSKKVDQEVQTAFETCAECIRERLEAEAARRAAAQSGTGEDSATEKATDETVEASPTANLDEKMSTLSFDDKNNGEPKPPGYWRKYKDEKKRLRKLEKERKEAEFNAMLEEIREGPVLNMKKLYEKCANKNNVPELAASGKDGVEEQKSDGPKTVGELELLKKSLFDIVETATATMELQFESVKHILQCKHSGNAPAAGDGKKKRRKRNKKKPAAEAPAACS